MKHVFIVNPISGKGRALLFIEEIKKYFENNGGDYEIVKTEYVHHATELAKKYSETEDVTIYSVGGDGTMKEVLDGISDKAIMCVIPGGTGNDFYKSIDKRKNEIYQIIKDSVEGEVKYVDYGTINSTSKFLNICSFGLDADINEYAAKEVKGKVNIPNSLVYAYAAFKVGLHPSTYKMECEIDGKKYENDILLLATANGRYYGGMFLPAPNAEIDDGEFKVCYFKNKIKFLRLIYLILKYVKGKHLKEKECVYLAGKKIKMKFDRLVNYQIDGESGSLKECLIEIHHKAMKLKIPKGNMV